MESKNMREIQCEMIFIVAIESSGDRYLNSMKVKMAKKYVISIYSIWQLMISSAKPPFFCLSPQPWQAL